MDVLLRPEYQLETISPPCSVVEITDSDALQPRCNVTVDDDGVYISLPPLPVKYKKNTAKQMLDYGLYYASEIEKRCGSLTEIIDGYGRKHLSFFFVWSTDRARIPDCDDVDIKKVIDAIMMETATKDGGETLSIDLQNLRDDRLPEGTYIKISKENQREKTQKYEDFLARFGEKFSRL